MTAILRALPRELHRIDQNQPGWRRTQAGVEGNVLGRERHDVRVGRRMQRDGRRRVELGGWLMRYATRPATTHVATTNVDDDDLLAKGFVELVQEHLYRPDSSGTPAPCQIVGISNPPQWDFMPTREAPLGYIKPWSRHSYPSFAGYTVCCRPQYDLCVLAFDPAATDGYFDARNESGNATQRRLRLAADRAGDDWRAWSLQTQVRILQSDSPQAVVVNHLENDQIGRLFEGWADRTPLRRVEDLPGMSALPDVSDVIQRFRRTPMALWRYLSRGARLAASRTVKERPRRQILSEVLVFPVWFMIGIPKKTVPHVGPIRLTCLELIERLRDRIQDAIEKMSVAKDAR